MNCWVTDFFHFFHVINVVFPASGKWITAVTVTSEIEDCNGFFIPQVLFPSTESTLSTSVFSMTKPLWERIFLVVFSISFEKSICYNFNCSMNY